MLKWRREQIIALDAASDYQLPRSTYCLFFFRSFTEALNLCSGLKITRRPLKILTKRPYAVSCSYDYIGTDSLSKLLQNTISLKARTTQDSGHPHLIYLFTVTGVKVNENIEQQTIWMTKALVYTIVGGRYRVKGRGLGKTLPCGHDILTEI